MALSFVDILQTKRTSGTLKKFYQCVTEDNSKASWRDSDENQIGKRNRRQLEATGINPWRSNLN
jgi:hypothetical protein